MEKVAENKAQSQVTGSAQKNEHSAEKDAEFKAKKAAAAKRFSEKQKERKASLEKLAKEVVDKKLLDKLAPETQKFINDILNPAKTGGFGGQSFFNKVFGDDPKVGDKITLLDYMKKTLQAKGKIDKAIKDWAEKGIIVEFKAAANQLESTYEIKKLA